MTAPITNTTKPKNAGPGIDMSGTAEADSTHPHPAPPNHAQAIKPNGDHPAWPPTVNLGSPGRTSRENDASPHYGGAEIHNAAGSSCTSGFSVNMNGGGRAMVTAGHCFDNGQAISSGSQAYGVAQGESGYPTWDMMLVTGPGQGFANKLYVDPCCPSTRTVIGKHFAGVNEYVCDSGFRTRAVCGIRVVSTSATYCDNLSQCTAGLGYAEKPGYLVVQNGDSGAPVYQRSGSSGALIVGLLMGQNPPSGMYYEHYTSVESHLGVTVAVN